MKIIMHAGMHKTGSSSIQDHLHKSSYPGIRYVRWHGGNHSSMFVLLFQDVELLDSYHSFKLHGPDFCARLPQMRERWLASLTEDLDRSRETGETLVFSAEDISSPMFSAAVGRMNAFFRQWTDDITVLAYVRSPLSYAASAFQQMLKGSTSRALNAQNLWPFYKNRFALLDELFGRDRVTLTPYDRLSLTGGDVVHDFVASLGLDFAGAPATEANTTLSAEATALLFTQRRLGLGFVSGFNGAQKGNSAFITALRDIGLNTLTFSDSLWGPVLEKNRADLDWINDRLGRALHDPVKPDAIAISEEEDLFRLATESQPALEAALLKALNAEQRPPIDKTVSTLELLRSVSYESSSCL